MKNLKEDFNLSSQVLKREKETFLDYDLEELDGFWKEAKKLER